MYKLCALSYLTREIKLSLLSRNFSVVTNQTTQPTKHCISPLQKLNHVINLASCRHAQLSFSQNALFLPVRKFSLTKVVYSNRSKHDREVKLLIYSLLTAVIITVITVSTMDHHQDYVIIEPEATK